MPTMTLPKTTLSYSIKYDTSDSNLNGAVDLGNSPAHIAMGRNKSGLLELFFAGTDNVLYHIRQVSGSTWEGLGSLGANHAEQVAVASNTSGQLEVFYIGTDNGLYHIKQAIPDQNTWGSGLRLSGASAKRMTIGQNQDGRLEIFYVGTNNDLYHNWQVSPGSTQWAGEARLSGASAKQVAVGQNADGRLEVFYVGTNNDLYHNVQASTNNSQTWKGEQRLSGASANQVAVGRNQDGRLEVVYFGTNHSIYHNAQLSANNSSWAGEALVSNGIGGTAQVGTAQQIVVGKNERGVLELFYVAASQALHHSSQTGANGTWNGEARIESQDYATEVALVNNADGSLSVAYISVVVNGDAGGGR